jgi:hypothetical protein
MDQEIDAVAEQMKKLPPEVQQVLTSPDFEKKLMDLSLKNRLHIDQMARLKNETTLVMMGLEDPANFYDNLLKEVRLSPEVAEKVQDDVAKELFEPIREAMKRFVGAPTPIISSPTPSPAPAVPPTSPVSKLPPIAPKPAVPPQPMTGLKSNIWPIKKLKLKQHKSSYLLKRCATAL